METLIYLLKSSLLLALFAGCYKLFFERETFFGFNRLFLLAGMLISAVFPAFIFTRTVYLSTSSILMAATSVSGDIVEQPAAEVVDFDLWQVALLIYAIGVVFFICRFLYQLSSLYFYLKNRGFEAKNGLKYVKIDGVEAPFSFLKTIVFDAEAHSRAELAMILHHEEAHAQGFHSLDLLLGKLICALLWFNPFAWIYARFVDQNLEFLADQQVQNSDFSPRAYQFTLLKNSTTATVPHLAQSFYKSFIKKRIIMLNTTESKNINRYKVLLLLPFLAAFLWSFNVKEVKVFGEKQTEKSGVLVEKSPKTVTNSPENEVYQKQAFRFTIAATATEEEISAIAEKLEEEYRIVLKYKNLNYNDDGLITSITMEMKDLRSRNTTNLNLNSSTGVSAIELYRTEDSVIGFNSVKNNSNVAEEEITKIKTSKSESNTSTQQTTEEETMNQTNEKSETIRALEAQNEELISQKKQWELQKQEMEKTLKEQEALLKNRPVDASMKENTSYSLNTDLSKRDILWIVDGKEMYQTEFELLHLDPNDIESMNVFKGEEYLKKFTSEKAKNKTSVIEVKLKKKNEENKEN